ncbi:MAG TPA: protein-disulfide reductase DsbD N-terminal domain-containing protein [Casimicrobiaceae bacterium]|nr:protein-disulfide reductase DsbD N-terminal domain-containing protein [Casimicrobiaceae bacterium]
MLLWASQPAIAAGGLFSSEPTPLPPEQAFRLSARGLDARTLEVRFDVVDGYYLYRDKLAFAVQPGDLLASSRPDLPAGKHKHDDFFGDVEIYRGRVVVKLPLTEAASGRTVQLQTQSQGCADAGLCYPPTVQMLNVAVPSAGGGPGPLVEAPHSRSGLFGK